LVFPSLAARLVALILAVVAISQPYWNYSVTIGPSGSWLKLDSNFYGDRVIASTYTSDGTLRDQRVVYYSNPNWEAHNVSAVMGNENWLVIALAGLAGLGTLLAVPPVRRPQLRPLALLLDVLLLVVAAGAPAYLAATIGPAANMDLSHSISGFMGSATSGGGFTGETWGPGMGWFLVVGASILAFLGIVLGHRPVKAPQPTAGGP
jgi:hypothetical protein